MLIYIPSKPSLSTQLLCGTIFTHTHPHATCFLSHVTFPSHTCIHAPNVFAFYATVPSLTLHCIHASLAPHALNSYAQTRATCMCAFSLGTYFRPQSALVPYIHAFSASSDSGRHWDLMPRSCAMAAAKWSIAGYTSSPLPLTLWMPAEDRSCSDTSVVLEAL